MPEFKVLVPHGGHLDVCSLRELYEASQSEHVETTAELVAAIKTDIIHYRGTHVTFEDLKLAFAGLDGQNEFADLFKAPEADGIGALMIIRDLVNREEPLSRDELVHQISAVLEKVIV